MTRCRFLWLLGALAGGAAPARGQVLQLEGYQLGEGRHVIALTRRGADQEPSLVMAVVFRAPVPMIFHEDSVAARSARLHQIANEATRANRSPEASQYTTVTGVDGWAMARIVGDSVEIGSTSVPIPTGSAARVVLVHQVTDLPTDWSVVAVREHPRPLPRLFWPRAESHGELVRHIVARDRPRFLRDWLSEVDEVRRFIEGRS